MTDLHPRTLVGERANPHPSQAPEYVVEVVDEDELGVTVQYLAGGLSWWITREAWASCKALTKG